MYVEAICPLCFASHVVAADMRGERLRCEECEEVFVVSKKAKITNKKPPRPREVQPVDGAEEAARPAKTAEAGSGAKLVEEPPRKKKAPADDEDEVLEIPDDAVQSGAPVVKKTPAAKRRREEEDEDRPRKRRRREEDDDEDEGRRRKRPAARRSGTPVGLIVGLSAGAVILLGLIGIGAWLVAREESKPAEQAKAPMQPLNNPAQQPMRPAEAQKAEAQKAPNPPPVNNNPPLVNNNPPPVFPPVQVPPVVPPQEPPKPVVWNVKVDPPAAVVKLPANVKDQIKAPGPMPQLLFPTRPSPFVAIGGNLAANDERQVWNLEKGAMTGKVVGAVPTFGGLPPVLSPDGAYMAYLPQAKNGAGVDVWALGPGKVTSIDIGGVMAPDLLDFAGPGRLLTGRREGLQKLIVRVYDVATGKEERQLDVALPTATFVRDSVAVSPGGGYLAVVSNEGVLWVYDLKTGATVAERAAPSVGPRRSFCQGLSFSPDGSELAGLFVGGAQWHLVCWDVAKGDVVSNTAFTHPRTSPGAIAVYKGHVLDWVGDHRGWLLYGYTILDRKANKVTLQPPPAVFGSPVPRHLVGPDHVVTFKAVTQPGKPPEQVLTVSRFDPDKP